MHYFNVLHQRQAVIWAPRYFFSLQKKPIMVEWYTSIHNPQTVLCLIINTSAALPPELWTCPTRTGVRSHWGTTRPSHYDTSVINVRMYVRQHDYIWTTIQPTYLSLLLFHPLELEIIVMMIAICSHAPWPIFSQLRYALPLTDMDEDGIPRTTFLDVSNRSTSKFDVFL